jgi:hypothetical protein
MAAMGWTLATGRFAAPNVVAWVQSLLSVNPRVEREPELYELLRRREASSATH